MNDLLQLAEIVLAKHGPIMLRAGCWCGVNDNCICPTTRPLTASELAAPDGDRPNAHVDRLFWSGDFGTLLHTKHGWRGHGWAGDHLMDGPWCATRHHAQLAAAAGEDER